MLGIPPQQLWWLHCPSPSPAQSQGFPGGKGRRTETEVNTISPSVAQGPDWHYPTPWVSTERGKQHQEQSWTVMNLPWLLPAVPVLAAGSTRASAQQSQPQRMKRSSSRAQQPPDSNFARAQPSPRSWLSLGLQPFLLPVSHSSTSLQHSETDSELPPGRKRRQRRGSNRSNRYWAASTSPEPRVTPYQPLGVFTRDPKPPT